MYHAFLIIAHNNFAVLQRLVSALDAGNTAIFIHIDAKAGELPEIKAEKSPLCFVCPRVDVRWGDKSQIECELRLLEFSMSEANKRNLQIDYFHIISGVHFPLFDLPDFDQYFNERPAAVFQPMETSQVEIDMKIRRKNICTKTFKSPNLFIERSSQFIWRISNVLQRIFHLEKIFDQEFIKTCQWCSLSYAASCYLVAYKKEILSKYKYSFCGDEFFAASELKASGLSDFCYKDNYLYQIFEGPSPRRLNESDILSGKTFGYLWARKCENEALFDLLEK